MEMKSYLPFLASALLAITSVEAAAPWHHPLSLANQGYWPQRVAVTITNGAAQPAAGEPVAVSLPALAGAKVEALRVCQADGVELLFDLRDARGEPKRTGALAATDKLIVPAACAANSSITIFVYAGNNEAWAVPDFFRGKSGSGNYESEITPHLRVSAGEVEQLQLRQDAPVGANAALDGLNRLEVRARNLTGQTVSESLVRVNVRSALIRLPDVPPGATARVGSNSGSAVPAYQPGQGTDLFFVAQMPPRSERLFHVSFSASRRTEPATALADYEQLLTGSPNLAPNGSFENGTDAPAAWQKPGATSARQVTARFSGDARFGKRSLELTVGENSRGDWVGWHSGEIPVQPGATYLLSGWLKAVGLKGSAGIHAHFHDASGALTKSGAMTSTQPPVGGDSDWQNSRAFVQAPPDAATIQLHLTMNTQGTLRHDGLVLCHVIEGEVVGVHTPAVKAPASGLHVWEVNPLVKVFPDTPPREQAKQVAVELARNEYEPFQLALRGRSGGTMPGVEISVSTLTQANGAALPPVKIERVGFVPIDHPSAYYSTDVPEWCRKVPRGSGATDGWAGWWPDPLAPEAQFDLAANQTQPVWFTLRAPKDAAPGDYRGEITVRAGGRKTTLPLRARVLPFTLPDKTQLRAIFDFRFGPGGVMGSGAGSKAERRRWLRFIAEHRLGIDAIQPSPKFNYQGGKVTMDAAEFDEEAQFCFDELGMNAAYTPHFFYLFGWAYPPKKFFGLEPLTPEWTSAFQQSYRLFVEHLRTKGWHDRFVYYISDEPHFQHEFVVQQMQKLCKLIHEVDPAIPIYSSTWRHCAAWDDSLDLWGVGQYGCFPVAEMERLQKAGKQMWFTCDGQMATDTPFLATERMLPYYCHKYGVKGFEFWGLAWWTYDPWKIGWHQFIRQSDEGKKYYWVRYPNGDGFLAYPGKAIGVEGPVSTIRLEQVREGLEDYEAMAILAGLVAKAKPASAAAKAGAAALAQAKELVAIPNAGGLRSTEILPNPDQIPAIRKAVNAAIVRLMRE